MPDVMSRALDQLTSLADRANEQCSQGRYDLAGKEVGALLTELQAHVRTADSADRQQAVCGIVNVCFAAGVVASRLGSIDLAVTAARRGYDVSRRYASPGLLGFARWYWALELTTLAARTRAQAVLTARESTS